MEHAKFEEVEVGSAIHGAFGGFEPVHGSFDLPVAPRLLHGSLDGSAILLRVPE